MESRYDKLVEFLKDKLGDGLRAVGRYDKDDYEVLFTRDDIAEEFDKERMERIHHEMVLKSLENQHVEYLFKDDELHCSIYQFESSIRLHFVHEDYRGYYVSLDYNGDVNPSKLVEDCMRIMN